MLLTNFAPLQLKSKLASSYAGGFTFPHQIHDTKENLLNRIKIYLAGGIAEEIIFGDKKASIGRSHDREQASILAIDFVRKYGFEENFQVTYNLEDYPHRMLQQITDKSVEDLMKKLAKETRSLLEKNRIFLINLSKKLMEKGDMTPKEIVTIAKKFGLNVNLKEEGFLHISGYAEKLREQ